MLFDCAFASSASIRIQKCVSNLCSINGSIEKHSKRLFACAQCSCSWKTHLMGLFEMKQYKGIKK